MGSRNQEAGSRPEPSAAATAGFRKLIAWQKADDLACAVYAAVKDARIEPWLKSQACRAAFSVPSNIAEGYARGALGEYLHFLDFARGSLAEVDYALHFFRRMELLPLTTLIELEYKRAEAGRVLQGLWRSLKQKGSGQWDHTSVRDGRSMYVVESDAEVLP